MDLTTLLLFVFVFIFTFALAGLCYLVWADNRFAHKASMKKRLLYFSAGGMHGGAKISIYKESSLKNAGALSRFLYRFPRVKRLDALLLRAKSSMNASTFVVLSGSLAMIGLLLALKIFPQALPAVAGGPLLGILPYLLLRIAGNKNLMSFEEQLPEALDLMARAIRSGHAMTSAMEMVSGEMENPIAEEFGVVVDEVKFGLTLQEALENLCERIPVQDLRFFTISLVVHKETGGNIAEVLDKLSRLIRERVQFKRQVKAITAEGRLSAIILQGLPLLMFVYLYFINYDYLSLLWTEPLGRLMMVGAISAQITGFFVIKKMIAIDI